VRLAAIIERINATLFVTAEKAIRPICQRYPPQMLQKWCTVRVADIFTREILPLAVIGTIIPPQKQIFAVTEKGKKNESRKYYETHL
jgi:hypothetical protein